MSLTLGEKLRQAREERGISISEVAEQTRISPHYLDLIENDDYRTLPGGIFNKGFVKSYAKYVGIDEQEALQDYSRLITNQEGVPPEDPKTYKPEVLTDDRASSSMVPTIIFAVIILGLMSWGLLKLVDYIQNQPTQTVANANTANNTNTANTAVNTNANAAAPAAASTPNEIKVEFKPTNEPISLTATVDGRATNETVTPEAAKTYTGQQSVKLRYYRGFADKVQITVNGKQITPPAAPARGNGVEFEINKNNVVEVLQSGQVPIAANPASTNANAGSRTAPR
ncbi:MAG TPA: helix-turn-helix domain-containing protein [Pyrinomonadaceae bacterium]|jgi:cytoskeletal protein RodZ